MSVLHTVIHNTPWYLAPLILIPGGGLIFAAATLKDWHDSKADDTKK